MSLDSLCRWQVQVSVYCAWRIPAHLRCTQCSILLHLMDICFLTCICLWQISQIPTFLFKVVGPGLVSTSPAFVSSSASYPAGPHDRHAQKTVTIIIIGYSPFSIGLNTPSPAMLMKSIGAAFFTTGCPPDVNHMRGMHYQIVINSALYK